MSIEQKIEKYIEEYKNIEKISKKPKPVMLKPLILKPLNPNTKNIFEPKLVPHQKIYYNYPKYDVPLLSSNIVKLETLELKIEKLTIDDVFKLNNYDEFDNIIYI